MNAPQCVSALLALLAALELGLRLSGYGAPLLYVADAHYEYALAPNQRTHRLGVSLETNRFGMRSPDFDPARDRRDRALVMGDSVIAGGNWTAQDKLATSLIQSEHLLALNVSAGSWGPGNLLAYVEGHGVFGARAGVLVLSSHDLGDDRTFGPLDTYAHPTRAPSLALLRTVDHYLLDGPVRAARRAWRAGADGDARESLLRLLNALRTASVTACILYHRTASELDGHDPDQLDDLISIATAFEIPVVDTADAYRAAGPGVFRDDIHLTDEGQAVLARQLRVCLARISPASVESPGPDQR
jgi:hypothetical protein